MGGNSATAFAELDRETGSADEMLQLVFWSAKFFTLIYIGAYFHQDNYKSFLRL